MSGPTGRRRVRTLARPAFAAGILLVGILASSCRAGPAEQARPQPGPPSPPAEGQASMPPATPPEGDPPPVPPELRFTAPRLGGGEIRGAEYAGRDVAIWFWAPW